MDTILNLEIDFHAFGRSHSDVIDFRIGFSSKNDGSVLLSELFLTVNSQLDRGWDLSIFPCQELEKPTSRSFVTSPSFRLPPKATMPLIDVHLGLKKISSPADALINAYYGCREIPAREIQIMIPTAELKKIGKELRKADDEAGSALMRKVAKITVV